jgi:tetratricopeptide (TPR) repeat protein
VLRRTTATVAPAFGTADPLRRFVKAVTPSWVNGEAARHLVPDLLDRIGARLEQAPVALGLGDAYLTIAALRDLDQAERWYRRALDLSGEDTLGRARSMARLGAAAYERFVEARAAGESPDRLTGILGGALQFSTRALDLTPAEAPADLARIYRQLGAVYRDAGDIERSLVNYQRAIQQTNARPIPTAPGRPGTAPRWRCPAPGAWPTRCCTRGRRCVTTKEPVPAPPRTPGP